MYTCIVIDDDERSINNLANYIEQYPNLEVVKQYLQPLIALDEISRMEKVDIIFMDVDMPTLTGIELAKMVRHKTNKLIFTTAHSKYAFDAYELHADAYLLKPFNFAKFAEKVNRVLSQDNILDVNDHRNKDYILVKTKEKGDIVKLQFKEIILFESSSNYIEIFISSNKEPIVTYLTLKDILTLLSERGVKYFMQIHRAFIISLIQIKSIRGNMIYMNNNRELQIGGHYKDSVRSIVEKNLVTTNRKASK